MRNNTLIRPIPRENHPISSRTPTRIYLFTPQNRKLIIRSRVREREPLTIIILMRVTATASRLAGLVVAVALLDCGVDVGLDIAC